MSFKNLGSGNAVGARFGFRPFLFVETGFERSQHPGTAIFALAALESHRHVSLSSDIADAGHEKLLTAATEVAKAHYATNSGKLLLWGDIDYYLLYLGEEETVKILPNGAVTSERGIFRSSRSSLKLN